MQDEGSYDAKFARIAEQNPLGRLPTEQRAFLYDKALEYRFSHQELRQLGEIGMDLSMWGEPSISELWPQAPPADLPPKARRARILDALRQQVERLRNTPKVYGASADRMGYRVRSNCGERESLGLGTCPVASQRTRCCNLLTLDAVENCGFGCSYCSIQSFYHGEEVRFDRNFGAKLATLTLDPQRTYHIGTGQSSDSLMWGNRFGILDALTDLARRHPNLILELKTKSKNIAYLLKHPIPRNLVCTFSLNPQRIIANEEHRTATLDQRLAAARRLADRSILVGFHFHPMVHYADWERDYADLFARVVGEFDPSQVAMVSLGTLTFTKSVIRRIRGAGFASRILQMPLTDSDGKLSYPEAIKREMFCHAYRCLAPWHGRVFFYLCMENHRLWREVFGYDYPSNQAFEAAMKAGYMEKIRR